MLLGRNSELQQIIASITATSDEPARLAILGGGGMGKSTLALNALHHPEVVDVFGDHRYFVSCESAESAGGLLSVLATHLEISGDQLRKRVLAAMGSAKLLLVLDNFETPWEEYRQRVEVEQLLGVLTALPNLTLVLTLRGSERPLGTSWTTPVLEPLKPLDLTAARHIFAEVASLSSEEEGSSETLELLGHLDGIPLAITLAASVARDTSVAAALASWQAEGTRDVQSPDSPTQRLSSLDVSIRLSIESSRVACVPQTLELLQLLALLPSGLAENFQHPAIRSMRRATSALKSSLLAYRAGGGYLRSLCPIRTYILRYHPPPYSLAAPLEQHYREIAKLAWILGTDRTKPLLEQLVPEWANVELLCSYVLEVNDVASWPVAVVADFDRFLHHTGLPRSDILQRAVNRAVEPRDQLRLLCRLIVREPIRANQAILAREAIALANEIGDLALLVEAKIRLGVALQGQWSARQHFDEALAAVRDAGPEYTRQRGECWNWLSYEGFVSDDYTSCIDYGLKAIACFNQDDYLIGVVHCRTTLSHAYLRLGRTKTAATVLADCLELCDKVGSMERKPPVLESLAGIAFARGEFLEAMRLHEECRRLHQRWSRPGQIAYQTETIATLFVRLGDTVSARRCLEEARALNATRTTWEELILTVREAIVCQAEHNLDLAETLLYAALRSTRSLKAIRVEIIIQGLLGEIALERARDANSDVAAELIQRGLRQFILQLALCTRINNMMYMIPCIGWLGQALLAQGDYTTARSVLSWALDWSARAEMGADRATVLMAFARLEQETGASQDASRVAGKTALDAAQGVRMGRLIAECEAQIAADSTR